jgi:serine O-acetyltransferase
MGHHFRTLQADLRRYYPTCEGGSKPSLRNRLRIWVTSLGLHCVVCYRFGQFAEELHGRNRLVGLLPRWIHFFLSYFVQMVYHIRLDEATIGPGLYIGHVGTIHLGRTVIGRNFTLSHNVTVGIGHTPGKEGLPSIGDDVWVGTGSILFGAIRIGNRVTVASGTVLSQSVPDGCLVGGNPGRVLMRDYDNSHLIGQRRQIDEAVSQ